MPRNPGLSAAQAGAATAAALPGQEVAGFAPYRAAAGAVAVAAGAAGLALAASHPLWPSAMACAFVAWCAVAWRWPGAWLAVIPAALPLANLTPWSGWLAFEEFDLLLLGAVAAGYARLAWPPADGALPWASMTSASPAHPVRSPAALATAAFAVFGSVAFVRGVLDAGGWQGGAPTQDMFGPLNAWRVFKPLPFALLLAPLARHAFAADPDRASARFVAGMLGGAVVVSLAVLWERAAFPGLFDWGNPYRATALFWEMHLGGAAIDGWLALALPFVAGALWGARTPWRWAALALLAALLVHACLATFSRGVYLATAGALALQAALGGLRWRERRTGGPGLPDTAPAPRWRTRANAALIGVLLLECAVALHGRFLRERVAEAGVDVGGRIEHWRRGVGLLRGPTDWLFGIGTGRVPAHYMQAGDAGEAGAGHESAGAIDWIGTADGGRAVRVSGPRRDARLGGRHALAQRVVPVAGTYRAEVTLRATRDADVVLLVCERQLLYAQHCRGALLRVTPGLGEWRQVTVPLRAVTRPPAAAVERLPRLGFFTLAVRTPGGAVDVARIALHDRHGAQVLANGDFADGAAHWLPVAQHYFVPWHVDSLPLDLLVERGALSLGAFAVLAALAMRRLTAPRRRRCALAPMAAASLAGGLLVGCVSSLMDMPRVAFLLLVIVLVAARGWDAAPRKT